MEQEIGITQGRAVEMLQGKPLLCFTIPVWTSLVRTDRSLFTEARLQFFSGVLKAVRIFAGKALGVSVSSYMEKREERKKLLKLGAGPLSLNG
uniref:Uncharacterized protein n=1 Tax=Zea mays TaxID=4577 RepID=A0A804UJQ1_MAIZE